jgi:surface antigen
MNIKTSNVLVMCSSLFFLEGCDPSMVPYKQTQGAMGGAVIGGVLGSQVGGGSGRTAAIIAGTMLGGLIGSAIGAHLDETDRSQIATTMQNTPTGATATWVNHGGNNTVTPTSGFFNQNGRDCRKYQSKVIINGNRETIEGTACRRPDGMWEV